jgi:hypothetical protein
MHHEVDMNSTRAKGTTTEIESGLLITLITTRSRLIYTKLKNFGYEETTQRSLWGYADISQKQSALGYTKSNVD